MTAAGILDPAKYERDCLGNVIYHVICTRLYMSTLINVPSFGEIKLPRRNRVSYIARRCLAGRASCLEAVEDLSSEHDGATQF